MRIDAAVLLRWQHLDAAVVVAAIADHAKEDGTFRPTKNPATSRWHVTVSGSEFELLLTGTKFWDTRARTGGGGAVDLAMHLGGMDFKRATLWLQDLRL
jgi:hypothetical protein